MSSKVKKVVVDGLVLLKIMRHSRGPVEAQGPLLGMLPPDSDILEVTNCFPYAQDDDDHEEYQIAMMRSLRDVNLDHLQVGWYQSSQVGSFMTEEFVGTQFAYQSQFPEAVVLVFDPARTSQGALCFKAFRLSEKFMSIFQDDDITLERMRQDGMKFEDIVEEVPVLLKTSHLGRALLEDLRADLHQDESFDHLDLTTHVFLEKNIRLMMDCVDELSNETQKYQNYQRNLARQEQQRREQHDRRNGDDEQGSHKPPPPFSCLDTLLITAQISRYCKQISQFTSQSFGKLYMAQGLQTE